MPRGRYGVDAPGLVGGFLVVGVALAFAGFALLALGWNQDVGTVDGWCTLCDR